MPHDAETIRDFLEETLSLAGTEITKRFGTRMRVESKSDRSLLTDADLASEAVILARIRRYYPDDEIYSEESGLSSDRRRPGGHIWVIDPLDGTTNFANNYPFFCVSIGRGQFTAEAKIYMTAGGVLNPLSKKVYVATRGRGATCNGQRLAVAGPRQLPQSFLVTGFYYNMGETLSREIRRFARVAQECQSIRRDGAAALDLALVAEGTFDAFWELGLQPWDVAAGSLLVAEAGGTVLNYGGDSTYNIENDGLIAGAPATAAELQRLLVQIN